MAVFGGVPVQPKKKLVAFHVKGYEKVERPLTADSERRMLSAWEGGGRLAR
jgi:hypothetical protein